MLFTILTVITLGFGILYVARSKHPKAVAFREWLKNLCS